FRLLFGEIALDPPAIVNLGLDHRHALDLVVEHNGQIIADVSSGPSAELLGPDGFQIERDLISEPLLRLNATRISQVAAGDDRDLIDDVKTGVRDPVTALLAVRQYFLIRRAGERDVGLFPGVKSLPGVFDGPDLQLRLSLNQLFDAFGIVNARHLQQDL